MKLQTPLKTVHNNLMLTKSGEIWAYYRITPSIIASGNTNRLDDHKGELRNLLENIAKFKEIHLEMFPKQLDVQGYQKDLERDFADETMEIGKYYNAETRRILENDLGSITTNDFLLGVRLKTNLMDESGDMKKIVANTFVSVTDQLVSLMGLEKEVDHSFFDQFVNAEQDLYELVARAKGVRLKEDELVYANRYNFVRDVQHHYKEEKKKRGVLNITDGILDPSSSPGFLKMTTNEGASYASFIVINQMPNDNAMTHLFLRAQNLSYPVEFHIKAQFQDNDKALRKISFAKQRFKETDKDMAEAGEDVDENLLEKHQQLNQLQTDIRAKNEILMHWFGCFVVYGKTKAECKQRSNHFINTMKDMEVQCVRPIADQLTLFYRLLHGEPLRSEKNWLQQSTHSGFAENLFGVSHQLGSNIGFYLGRVAKYYRGHKPDLQESIANSRDLVFFHMFLANQGIKHAATDSPHITITGDTGKGKSFLVKMMQMYLSFLNVKTLMVDPKDEVEERFKKVLEDPQIMQDFPMFADLIDSFHYITLDPTDPKNYGVLDPITFLEGYEARDTAQDLIEQIYDLTGKDEVKTELLKYLTETIEEKKRGEQRGLIHVVEKLQASRLSSVQNAGELLYQMSQNSILQLVFSDGSNQGLSLDNKVSILQIENLQLPESTDDPRFYSDSEKKSLSLMIPLAKFCNKFGSNKSEQTAILFDEAWILTKAKGGKRLLKSMRRVGRSYSNQLYLISQSVSDVDDKDDSGNIGAKFAFREESDNELIIDYMGLDKVEDNLDMISNLTRGHCLFQDFYGRTGILAVDCLFEEWAKAFETVDKTHAAYAEEELV